MPAANPTTPQSSALDSPLFYQLLIGEMELRVGEAGAAYEIMLDAARRTRDETVFRRAVEIALRARAGDQALAATKAWRSARPESGEALRYQIRLLVILNRVEEAGEPLQTLLAQTPAAQQPELIASLPRFLQRSGDQTKIVALLTKALAPYLAQQQTRNPARVTLGRFLLAAGEPEQALDLAARAHAEEPASAGPAMLALDLLPAQAAAEDIVRAYLQDANAEMPIRLGYVRLLASLWRYGEAVAQLEKVTRERPDLAPPWLTLGALQLDLGHPQEAEAALLRYLELRPQPAAPVLGSHPGTATPHGADSGDEDDEASAGQEDERERVWLMLARATEQRGDYAAAAAWLDRIDGPQRALEVQIRRASLLARQGRIEQARTTIQAAPETTPDDAKVKILAESQLLRDAKRWREAHALLLRANERKPADADLLYEQAMAAEKIGRIDEMEGLLRRVIELKPDNQHAYNALGYSLADRGLRLAEAQQLIRKALELAPNDPFITDSLGWVEFRLGHHDEALRLLRKAHAARPDAEIATHLGEVLWATGQADEAKRLWRDAKSHDAANEILRETLSRLKVDL